MHLMKYPPNAFYHVLLWELGDQVQHALDILRKCFFC